MNEVAKLMSLIKLKSQLKVIEQDLYNKMLNQDNLKLKKKYFEIRSFPDVIFEFVESRTKHY